MLSNQDFEKVCKLAKLSVTSENRDKFLDKLNSVFNWIDQLSKIDTSSVDSDFSRESSTTPERKDIPCLANTKSDILSNTKDKKFDMFSVPKIVE